MKNEGLLSIIIVSYNVKYFAAQCLYSAQKAIAGTNAEVIVVDNGSVDESVDYLQKFFPWVRFIANKENLGYARANNLGWRAARGTYVLFLNPDTLLTEDCLTKSLDVFRLHSKAGALGIHMLDGQGHFLPESKRGFPSVAAAFFKLSGLIKLFPRSRNISQYYLGWLPEKQTNQVEVLSGAYMMVKKQVLEETGGFDEQFFMYGEDIDLSFRIREAGYQNYYVGDSSIVHFKGESTRKDARYTRLFYQAMDIFVQKHYGRQSPAFGWLMRLAIGTGGVLSFARQVFSAGGRNAVPKEPLRTLLIGVDTGRQAAAAILLAQPGARKLEYRDDLAGLRNKSGQQADEIVFCMDSLPYCEVVKYMEEEPGKAAYFFYVPETNNIVGSNSRKRNGEIMLAKKG